ncbi:DNA cytosine methyltransferase [Paenibacillus sp. TAF43_2]|uniref:DNA cytosine methyltransferase n=1 Tax=Paenibacillus sp. TAF43_2 TaxID=3233069 RepID=UPI003F9DA682
MQGFVARFPCQAFSIAGKREGFNDAIRGTVFFEIIRFASILKPEFIHLENVTGILSHDKGRTIETMMRTLDELGYVGEWCVLNSSAYVPQNRERVFIVAR